MNAARNTLLFVLIGVGAFLYMSIFTVDERELAAKFRFGEIVKSDYEPGAHFKVPIYNNVVKFEKRVQTINNPTEEFLTNEKKNLFVDFFVKWRVADAAQFYRSTAGNESVAAARLTEIIKDGIRGEFAKRTVQEVVTAQRAELMDAMLTSAGETASELGVQIIDVRVKRLDLPEQVSDSVFDRMRQERGRVASQLRAEGAEASERIRADADRQRTVILANARRDAERTRGEGDALSAEIYANAYERDAEFYAFYRSMRAYRDSVGRDGDILLLEPDSDFFKYFKRSRQPAAAR